MDDCTVLIYTHTESFDILYCSLKRFERFMPNTRYSICINDAKQFTDKFRSEFSFDAVYEYDDSKPFGTKLMSVIEQIETDYVLYFHENDILVDYVDMASLETCYQVMKDKSIDQLRLYCTGCKPTLVPEQMFPIEKTDFRQFCTRPTIWKRSALLDIATRFKHKHYGGDDFEAEEVQTYVRDNFVSYAIFTINDTLLSRKMWLYQSRVFPVLYATISRKWTDFPFYRAMLEELGKEFSIDFSKRGIYENGWWYFTPAS
jgi:hypothetical protein